MIIGIRADANETIGVGHIMRCISIGDALKDLGQIVVFLTADHSADTLLAGHGFEHRVLDTKWNVMQEEQELLLGILKEERADLLLVDSYYVTEHYLKALRSKIKLAYLDDRNAFAYPVDILINFQIESVDMPYQASFDAAGEKDTVFLLGTQYAPLRKAFQNREPRLRSEVGRILITSGGSDQYNLTDKILQKLSGQEWFAKAEYLTVVGKFNVNKELLRDKWARNKNVFLLENVEDMQQVMEQCDLAITAGGGTLYELCSCAVPSIAYSFVDNQLPAVIKFGEIGVIPYAGDFRTDEEQVLSRIVEFVRSHMENPQKLSEESKKVREIADGNGAKRLAKELLTQI